MSLTSLSFYFFFLLVLLGCVVLKNHNEYKKLFLVAASYYFYATLDIRFALLLLTLTIVNYISGNYVVVTKSLYRKKLALFCSISISLGILFYFKYANFFIHTISEIFSIGSHERNYQFINVLLPVGISFMTFQAITYPLDLYAKRLEKRSSILDFSLFMAFFPQLLSGPIVRASFFLPQLTNNDEFRDENIMLGLIQVFRGLIKKILIADILAVHIVDPAFSDPAAYSSGFLFFALVTFSFQIYMDLSGYTDIALGTGRMLGYKLPINFNRPYLATSISNYWQRWHISMSSFFRDYLYEAIAGWSWINVYFKLLIVFVAIGLWHGAGWNFILYGLVHGSLVGLEHYNQKKRVAGGYGLKIYRGIWLVLRIIQIFLIVSFSRILFRGEDLGASAYYLQQMMFSTSDSFPVTFLSLIALAGAVLLHFSPIILRDRITEVFSRMNPLITSGCCAILIYIFTATVSNETTFMYFQF